jgi:hypothetical protein
LKRQAEHRIRAAASLSLSSGPLAAALVMNSPGLAIAGAIAWVAWNTYEPAAATIAWILFSLVAIWEIIEVMNSWRVMRRFASQSAHDTARRESDR